MQLVGASQLFDKMSEGELISSRKYFCTWPNFEHKYAPTRNEIDDELHMVGKPNESNFQPKKNFLKICTMEQLMLILLTGGQAA